MITVEVKINGKVVASNSARNVGLLKDKIDDLPERPDSNHLYIYDMTHGSSIAYDRRKGPVPLAIYMLQDLNPADYVEELYR